MAQTKLITVDNFLSNPDLTRQYALGLEYQEGGGNFGIFPGVRAEMLPEDRESWTELLKSSLGQITGSPNPKAKLSFYFQLAWSYHVSWIHADLDEWAVVLPLTPDAPSNSGTGLFRHKATGAKSTIGLSQEDYNECVQDAYDETKWELLDCISNQYNRLVIYKGDQFHRSMRYFGRGPNTGRLFMVMFFSPTNDPTIEARTKLAMTCSKTDFSSTSN